MAELPPPEIGADEARDVADQVLSGRAYVEAARPPSLVSRFFDWVGDRFADLFDSLSSVGGRGVTAWIVIGAFVALILFFLSRLARHLGPLPTREADPDPAIGIVGDRSADEWLQLALGFEAAGDWRHGIRSRHRALVATLIDGRVVESRPGQTAGEIARRVREQVPASATAIDEATYLFKDVWYGWIEAGPRERDRFAELAGSVTSLTAEQSRLLTTGGSR